MTAAIRQVLHACTVAGALLVAVSQAAHAQQGSIAGTVTDQATGAPLEAARVVLVGPNRIESTGREGRYTFRGVSPGNYQVRVLRLGYKPEADSVTVPAGETVAQDFALTAAPVQLDEIVSTATGQQSKLEIGNSIATIPAAQIAEEAPITEFGNLLSGRAAGVTVLKSSGATGTGTKIRIRGSNSVSLSNEPLYYIDGVRMDATPNGYAYDIGGQSTSRINDLNPDDIENIEIVKGPSAATLYGIQAANGVVLITTKRGAVGRARWNAFVEQGAVEDPNTYRTNYFGRSDDPAFDPAGPDGGSCTLLLVTQGDCVQSRVDAYNPLNDAAQRPLSAGHRQQYGVNVAGGSEAATYYVAAEYEGEVGVYKLRGFDFDSVQDATNNNIPAEQLRPNDLSKLTLRANGTSKVGSNADLQLSLGYVTSQLRLPENDNTLNSVIGSGDGSGLPQDLNRGWFLIPAEIYAEQNQQGIGRFTGGLTANWRPQAWLTTRATFGYDVTNQQDTQFWPTGQVNETAYPTQFLGELNVTRAQTSQLSVDLLASASYDVSSAWSGRTAVGGQFFRNLNTNSFSQGNGLARGAKTIFGAATTDASDDYLESRSAGGFVDQQMSWQNRLFLTAGLRVDDNSAFGKNFNAKPLPKLSASWLTRDEQTGWLNTLRLRAAYGQSTQQPGSIDALRFYSQAAVRKDGGGQSGVTIANLGNEDLKPELSQEIETGFDAGLFGSKVTLEATYFYKETKDALIQREIVPSLGATRDQFFNLGKVANQGIELRLDSRIIDKPDFAWDLTITGSFTKNRLQDLGEGIAPITLGFIQQHVEGYPLGGIWDRPILSFNDANGNGIIEPAVFDAGGALLASAEYVIGPDPVFRGAAIPTREFGLRTGFTFFRNLLNLGALFDYRGGHWIENSTDSFRCNGGVIYCRGLVDPTAPLEEQANAAAATYGDENGVTTEWGFFEPAWFVKLRELSLTFNAPDHIARLLGASRASLTLSGRNLWTVDDYSGIDPEVNGFGQGREGGSNFAATDFFSQPQVRYWVARVNLGF